MLISRETSLPNSFSLRPLPADQQHSEAPMSYGYTYEFPDPDYFLNTVQTYLIAIGKTDVAKMLEEAACSFASTGSYSGRGNDHHGCVLFLTLPLKLHFALTEASAQEIMLAADEV